MVSLVIQSQLDRIAQFNYLYQYGVDAVKKCLFQLLSRNRIDRGCLDSKEIIAIVFQ